jgi:hypothetical protein
MPAWYTLFDQGRGECCLPYHAVVHEGATQTHRSFLNPVCAKDMSQEAMEQALQDTMDNPQQKPPPDVDNRKKLNVQLQDATGGQPDGEGPQDGK